MKKKHFIPILLLLFVSCKSETSKEAKVSNLLDINETDYSVKIQEMGLSSNSNQQAGGSSGLKLIQIKNTGLKDALTQIYTKEYMVDFTDFPKRGQAVNIIVNNKSGKILDLDSLLLQHLSTAFPLETKKGTTTQTIFELKTENEETLRNFKSDKSDSQGYKNEKKGDSFSCENCSLDDLAMSLKLNTGFELKVPDGSETKYNFELENILDEDKVISQLEGKYGISTEKLSKSVQSLSFIWTKK